MNTKIRIALVFSTALTTAALLAGCSSNSSSAGASGMNMEPSTPAASAGTGTGNAADVMFAQMMIQHHMQAVEMSDMILKKTGVDAKVTALAKKIKAAQSPEIDTMNGLLTSYGEATVTGSGTAMSGMGSSGMMSDADMRKLENAGGAQASSLFLTQMIQHHTGAVTMAQAEVENGKDPAAVALAKKIVADQTAEIAEMKRLQSQL